MKNLFKNAFKKNKLSAVLFVVIASLFILSLLLSFIPSDDYMTFSVGGIFNLSGFQITLSLASFIFFMELGSEENSLFKSLKILLYFFICVFAFISAISYVSILRYYVAFGSIAYLMGYLAIAVSTLFLLINACGKMQFAKLKLVCFIVTMCGCLFVMIAGIANMALFFSSSGFFNFLLGTAFPTLFFIANAFTEKEAVFPRIEKPLKDSSIRSYGTATAPSLEDRIEALKLKLELGTITKEEYNAQIQALLSEF